MFAIKKHIPNAITSLNLLCGTVALVFAFKGRFDIAFPLMLLYNGEKGFHINRWFFYVFYPAHLLILALVHGVIFGF